MEIDLKNEIITDKHGRKFFAQPTNGQLHIVNRGFHYHGTTAFTHANDIFNLINTMKQRPSILALTCDNGPDYCPNSYLVFIAFAMLWKKCNLDQILIASYAPRSSKNNRIELAWGTANQALAQTILCPESKNLDNESEPVRKDVFKKALNELNVIWNKTSYSSKLIQSRSILPGETESPFTDKEYEEFKDVFENGPKSDYYTKYKSEIKFLFRHTYRRGYFLHIKKCLDINCLHCRNTVKHQELLEELDSYDENGTLLRPVFLTQLYDGKHYPSFVDMVESKTLHQKVREKISKEIKENPSDFEKCHWCSWYFQTKNDKKKHRFFCP